jgi:2-(1,2-epoxy-1,2-dihydrophenyl)acetyl-CoA isomerase
MSNLVLYSHSNGVSTIQLNRPDKFNSFNREMAHEMNHYLQLASQDDEVRCVVITGNGKAFCAGQDLAEAIDPAGPGLEKIIAEGYNPTILHITRMMKPVIAAVNGVAAGAGANIALACDFIVAKNSASFIQAFSKIGLIPDSGGTYFLPRLVGYQRAIAQMMLGEKIMAKDAENMGMIYKAFEDDVFDTEVAALANQLANMPTVGLALTKKALQQSMSCTLEEQLTHELKSQLLAGNTQDHKEGVQAFLEKRAAVFTGK